MFAKERHRRILALLRTLGDVTVERITAELAVSRETIRRDLLELEALGDVRRIHGGASLAESEPPIDVRAASRVKEKRAIAKAAAALVESGQTLFLDAGTTTSILAGVLASVSGLHIVTNSVSVAEQLAAAGDAGAGNADVHLVGGGFNPSVRATYGSSTIAEIQRFHADLAFLSPVGVDAEHGATSFVGEEAEVARAMSMNARETVIVADYTKIGTRSRVAYCRPDQIALLITNSRASKLACAEALARNIQRVTYV
ncbi:DeoR/GlpR family DNA-binding transcription regulator [Paraburkholderia sp. BCC1886]|uniref:DeoR/GlpR family DNA-binding transcription regulator n=1 Tax=Paraburkholderia sp. BCC1886 TaxID=2562670 RepID=UPI0011825ED1|nr:DeoR/GlpR family DNA-binding transcription regulator [Paraburkholderia sp. BCC1886]